MLITIRLFSTTGSGSMTSGEGTWITCPTLRSSPTPGSEAMFRWPVTRTSTISSRCAPSARTLSVTGLPLTTAMSPAAAMICLSRSCRKGCGFLRLGWLG